jgi:DNA-3-methyladenine glycosylase II
MHKEAIIHLGGADRTLAELMKRVGSCRLRTDRKREPYQALIRSVTYQQLNGTAAETIFNRFLALFPEKRFPDPDDILKTPDATMRSAGLSGAKTAAIKDIAGKMSEGIVPTRSAAMRMSDSELIERLTTIRGVGPWTVEMLLIFTLGRRDILPTTDYGVRKGFALTYGLKDLPHAKDLLAHGECWRPYRSIASWYLWRALDL